MASSLTGALELLLNPTPMLLSILSATLQMALFSSCAALLLGVPLGAALSLLRFPGRQILVVLNRTLMGLPPVVCGLICYMLFSGVGPLRHWKLLYTVPGMVIAQIILITPLVTGTMEASLRQTAGAVRETAQGLGLGRGVTMLLILNENRYQIISAYLMAFGRAMAEVGAVSMVGGAIAYKTNVMTTAIMMYTNRGDFTLGLSLGILLLLISLAVNLAVWLLQKRWS